MWFAAGRSSRRLASCAAPHRHGRAGGPGLLVTFVASTGATFDPGGIFGHEVYFDSLTMFVSLPARRALPGAARAPPGRRGAGVALARMPETACAGCRWQVWRTVSVGRLRAGDRVRVPVGQAFPADGALLRASPWRRSAADRRVPPGGQAGGRQVVAGSLNVGRRW
jgi:P-type Cu2+ transporter